MDTKKRRPLPFPVIAVSRPASPRAVFFSEDSAVGYRYDPFGICRYFIVVGNHQHSNPLFIQRLQQFHDLDSRLRIQLSCGLICQNDAGKYITRDALSVSPPFSTDKSALIYGPFPYTATTHSIAQGSIPAPAGGCPSCNGAKSRSVSYSFRPLTFRVPASRPPETASGTS